MNKIYMRGGNSGLYSPGNYRVTSNGCLRMILVRSKCGQPVANHRERFTFDIGILCEKILADKWKAENKQVELDVEVEEHIIDNVYIMGHIDAILEGRIIEEKSVQSVNSFKKIMKGGLYKKENIVQLLQYMMIKEHTEGTLLYTTVGYFGEKSEPGQQREFKVRITEDDKIIVNEQEESGIRLIDILYHRQQAAECLIKKMIFTERPEPIEMPWYPCDSCWLRPMCDNWDSNHDDNEFWSSVNNHLDKVGKR